MRFRRKAVRRKRRAHKQGEEWTTEDGDDDGDREGVRMNGGGKRGILHKVNNSRGLGEIVIRQQTVNVLKPALWTVRNASTDGNLWIMG
jgi:hypothetical protein